MMSFPTGHDLSVQTSMCLSLFTTRKSAAVGADMFKFNMCMAHTTLHLANGRSFSLAKGPCMAQLLSHFWTTTGTGDVSDVSFSPEMSRNGYFL